MAKLQAGAILFDTEVGGFFVRHRGGWPRYGLKTRIKGRQTILTIGRHGKGYWSADTARREAVRLLGLIRDGRDPAAERAEARTAPRFAAFAARYMAEFAAVQHRSRTVAEEVRLLRLHLLPALGTMQLGEITKADAAQLHSRLQDTPVAANRTLALLSSILGWAEKVGERPDASNPCRHVARFPERPRERVLTAEELARLGDALAGAEAARLCDWRMLALVRLLLFTGARLSEILTLQWAWIDLENGTARLPESKTGAKTLYLAAPALGVLSSLPRYAGNPHVLPGDRAGAPLTPPQKAWQRLRKAAGLGDLRMHDLRHAYASAAVAAGDSLFIVGKLLGHRQSATTERYAHLAPDPARAVADRNAGRLAAMLHGGKGEVVPIRA